MTSKSDSQPTAMRTSPAAAASTAVWTIRAVELLAAIKQCRKRQGWCASAILAAGCVGDRRQFGVIRCTERICRRLHRRSSRDPASARIAGLSMVSRSSRRSLARANGGDRPRLPRVPAPAGRRFCRRAPGRMAALNRRLSKRVRDHREHLLDRLLDRQLGRIDRDGVRSPEQR